MDLSQKKCKPCEGGVKPLDKEGAKALGGQVPKWKLRKDEPRLWREFTFKDFARAMKFVNKVADIAEFTHFVTRIKIVPSVADDVSLSETERTRGRALATALSMRVLSRTWQMLLKGVTEVQEAARPLAAAEMVLVRIAYVADLPTPDEAIRMID